MGTVARDVALCAVVVGSVGGAYWAMQTWAFYIPPPTRLEAPPAVNPPYPIPEREPTRIRGLDQILPDGEPAPPPPGVSPDELENRAA